ncbi:MAG TPA: hypothetical protein VEV61_19775 [Streptosporangiaceae bacterium]|nr:hypothetical protein [Streptosporangiaceae bacterium]
MNTADERLRAAARDALGIFPSDGELPPLSLPNGTHSRSSHVGAASGVRARLLGTIRARAWLTPVAAGAAVAIVIAGVVVARQATGGAAASGSGNRSTNSQSAAQNRERAQLDALVVKAFVPATGPQYDAGSRLLYLIQVRELQATAKCMAAAGYHISDQAAPFNLSTYADNSQMPDLQRIASTHEFVPPGGIKVPSYSRAEQHAYNTCAAQARVPFKGLMSVGRPLMSQWWKVIFRIQASGPVRARIPALNTCAARYGFPNDPYGNASGPIKAFPDFMSWVAGFMDGAGSRGASNATLRHLARHWTSVFVTCARPIVGAWERLQIAAQPGFLAQHASQLRKLDKLAWQLLGHHSSH